MDGDALESLLDQITDLLTRLPQALERRAAELHATGKDPEIADKLAKGADAMRDSGQIYVSWAKHYVLMASGHADATTDDDGLEDVSL